MERQHFRRDAPFALIMTRQTFTVEKEGVHKRLDVFLHQHFPELSRSRIQKKITEKEVSINGDFLKPGYKLNVGDSVVIEISRDKLLQVSPERIPLDILYEDNEVLVVNKSAGMIVHPVSFDQKGTLVAALLSHTCNLSAVNGPMRPGIVHRLDKDTSGALIVAKNDRSHLHIVQQLKTRELRRRYKALVLGKVEPEKGKITAPIGRHEEKMSIKYVGGKEAITNYEVSERFDLEDISFTLLAVSLETGRTHQIRVHSAFIGYPVAGDRIYGQKAPHVSIKRQALHAELIGFVHPSTGEYMEFDAPMPEDMIKQIETLRRSSKRKRL